MNLSQTIELNAGGVGSGRHPFADKISSVKNKFINTNKIFYNKGHEGIKDTKGRNISLLYSELTTFKNIKGVTTKVNLKDLIPTQDNVETKSLKGIIKTGPKLLDKNDKLSDRSDKSKPIVFEHEGKQYVISGHHRLSADILKGKSNAIVELVKS